MPSLPVDPLPVTQKRVKALLVMDVTESVRLMEQDEEDFVRRWRDFVEQAEKRLRLYDGRLVRSFGDGLAIEFEDARSCVYAAFALQDLSRKCHEGQAEERHMHMRMGAHLTEFAGDAQDIYGSGVNLTARIITLAGPGEVVVTSEVRDRLTAGLDADVEDLGECHLKHIKEPVRAYRVSPVGHARIRALMVVEVVESARLIGPGKDEFVRRWEDFVRLSEQRLLPLHEGHLVKRFGSGLMLEFADAHSCIKAAFALQKLSQQRNAGRPGAQHMHLRMGAHLAELLVGGPDVFHGADVNRVVRIVALARPGEIAVTAELRTRIEAGQYADIVDLGEQHLGAESGLAHVYRVRLTASSPGIFRKDTPSSDIRSPIRSVQLAIETTTLLSQSGCPRPFPPPWADAWGDDRYGLWAELVVKDTRQRLRWLEPGRFLMGSPEADEDRDADEDPQHEVTLTEGFWLADTACTQALWLAVMSRNPSYAQDDPQKPVEQVSWDDVRGFCQALQIQVPLPDGTEVVLPTEAQWEYSCRAGSATTYSFGEVISTARVNFNNDGKWQERLKARQTTLPVKALPANAWGLYQMCGNVREWCADAMREYASKAVVDPNGAMGDDVGSRAVRGGSWFDSAQRARSASRARHERAICYDGLGFRFVLRAKSQQGAGGPRPEGVDGA